MEDVIRDGHALLFVLLLEDCDSGLEVRGLNVRDESPLEAGDKPLFKRGYILGRTVAGENNLLVRVIERVEGVKKLFLGTVLACKKLHVIYKQNIDVFVLSGL